MFPISLGSNILRDPTCFPCKGNGTDRPSTMYQYFKFESDNTQAVAKLGLSHDAVSQIFLGPPPNRQNQIIKLLPGAPPVAQWFAEREYQAAELSYLAILNRVIQIPDPWTGDQLFSFYGFTCPNKDGLPFDLLPFFYEFHSKIGGQFWIVNYHTYGRVSELVLPSANTVIYDINYRPALAAYLEHRINDHATNAAGLTEKPTKIVGVVDLPQNFGHQLINNLSGIERLLRDDSLNRLDEIWICGREFFGPTELLYPEISNKIKKFTNRFDIFSELASGTILPIKLGSNIFPKLLRDRILKTANRSIISFVKGERHPLIAITVRSQGRKCTNFREFIEALVTALLPSYPRLGIVIDGWVFPNEVIAAQSLLATGLLSPNPMIRQDLEIAKEIEAILPPGMIVRNLIGLPILISLLGVRDIDAYVAHVGTLQHKLGFFSDAVGIVHGPREQLQNREGGAYQSEAGKAPLFISPSSVSDIAVQSPRGPSFYDYKIVNHREPIDLLKGILNPP